MSSTGGRELRGCAERDNGGRRGHGDQPSDHPSPPGPSGRLQRVGSLPHSRLGVQVGVVLGTVATNQTIFLEIARRCRDSSFATPTTPTMPVKIA